MQRLNSTLVPSPQYVYKLLILIFYLFFRQLYDFVLLLNNEEKDILQTKTYYKLITPRRGSQMVE